MKRKYLLLVLFVLILAAGFWAYQRYLKPNVTSFEGTRYLYVPTGATMNQVMDSLRHNKLLLNPESFAAMASSMGLDKTIQPGRYQMEPGMSNFKLIRMLRSGRQSPVKLVLNKLRTPQQIIAKLSTQLEPDSADFARLFQDSVFLKSYQINANQIQVLFMPNTYELYWNTPAQKAVEKIAKSFVAFWNTERKSKAAALGLTTPQVITMASIIEEETNKNDEKPRIASVYLNRLKIGMHLGADPTVKYAVGNFALKRITGEHTGVSSPYNTYLNPGLPPGPICTPSKESIEAVLNPEQTRYLFFCAKEDFSGYHNFAITYAEHQKNAQRYHQALNARKIR